jgi:ubiquinone/menaquinone biosynthesis C-methylase UbiE
MPDYGLRQYWDERYKANDTTFDWYVSLEPLKEILLPFLKPESKILMIGCGNSRLSSQLYESGYQNVTNIDCSEVVINQMKARCKDQDKMEWVVKDCTRMDFPDATFDLVVDKGTMDAMLCGANSFHNVYQMNKHVSRVMKKGAHFVVVTYGQPDTRIDHFRRKRLNWEIEHKTIDKPVFSSDSAPSSNYHVYLMTKGDPVEATDEEEEDDEEDDDFYDKFQASAAI